MRSSRNVITINDAIIELYVMTLFMIALDLMYSDGRIRLSSAGCAVRHGRRQPPMCGPPRGPRSSSRNRRRGAGVRRIWQLRNSGFERWLMIAPRSR